MRKNKLVILASVLCLGLCACGASGGAGSAGAGGAKDEGGAVLSVSGDATEGTNVAAATTLGDIFAGQYGDFTCTYDESTYQCVFTQGDTAYLVKAAMPDGAYAKLDEAEGDANTERELLADVKIDSVTEIGKLPTHEELVGLVGKTGAELTKDGYVMDAMSINGDETFVSAHKGDFAYTITFDGQLAGDDVEAAVEDAKVTEAGIAGISFDVFE